MDETVIKILKRGGIGALLTDTLYGLVGQALDKEAVRTIYRMKGRDNKKPLIILISSVNDLALFGVRLDTQIRGILNEFWPGPVSIILDCPLAQFKYLHRGTKTLAFRLPKKKSLVLLLQKTGPLVAPSANREGFPPAKNIKEAENYFGNEADFYLKGGVPKTKPSSLVRITSKGVEMLRK